MEVQDKRTKEIKKVFITSKMRNILWKDMSQRKIIDIGFLVGAWNKELYDQLRQFNNNRNNLVHKHENLLQILQNDEKKVKGVIKQGLNLLTDIKRGYVIDRSINQTLSS
jgi:hypothetical protein